MAGLGLAVVHNGNAVDKTGPFHYTAANIGDYYGVNFEFVTRAVSESKHYHLANMTSDVVIIALGYIVCVS